MARLVAILLPTVAGASITSPLRLPTLPGLTTSPQRCDALLRSLFVESPTVSPAKLAAACSEDVAWYDMNMKAPVCGPAAVEALLVEKFPPGSRLCVEKLADGRMSSGFTWHREADGSEASGLRGITYVELNEQGEIKYVQEGSEPLFKLDTLLEALLQAANANKKDEDAPKTQSYEKATPTTAEGIVRYLWEVAYPGGASPAEALEFFSDDIVYEVRSAERRLSSAAGASAGAPSTESATRACAACGVAVPHYLRP